MGKHPYRVKVYAIVVEHPKPGGGIFEELRGLRLTRESAEDLRASHPGSVVKKHNVNK